MSRPRAYYNEIDPYAAQWIRNLITFGWLTDGEVDERDIRDVQPEDLRGFDRCHFFAGLGGWEHALELARWSSDRPVWTGSCPCPPFSNAGKGQRCPSCGSSRNICHPRKTGHFICLDCGCDRHADGRHLWPEFARLIRASRPPIVFGEQVASFDGRLWLGSVQADLATMGYSACSADLCAAGVGAPHIRQRLWFVAHARSEGWGQVGSLIRRGSEGSRAEGLDQRSLHGSPGVMAHADGRQCNGLASGEGCERDETPAGRIEGDRQPERGGAARGMGNTERSTDQHLAGGFPSQEGSYCGRGSNGSWSAISPGFWSDADWIPCRDGKARPVEPLAQQMADGSTASLGRLRADTVAEIVQEILTYARAAERDPGEALLDVWCALAADAQRYWASGRLRGVHEAPVLLALLRQLADEGWSLAQSLPRPGSEASEAFLRSLRRYNETARAPRGRGLDEQRSDQHPDLVRVLSSVLARHAQAAWGQAFGANAQATFPLAHGAPARVGRLRAYGNAICAPTAAAFIEAALACLP